MDRPSLCRNVLYFDSIGPDASAARAAIVTHVYQPSEASPASTAAFSAWETGVGLVDLVVFGRASFEFRSCVPHVLAADLGGCGWAPPGDEPLAADTGDRK